MIWYTIQYTVIVYIYVYMLPTHIKYHQMLNVLATFNKTLQPFPTNASKSKVWWRSIEPAMIAGVDRCIIVEAKWRPASKPFLGVTHPSPIFRSPTCKAVAGLDQCRSMWVKLWNLHSSWEWENETRKSFQHASSNKCKKAAESWQFEDSRDSWQSLTW